MSILFAALLLTFIGCSASKNSGNLDVQTGVMTDVQEFQVDGVDVLLRQSNASPVVSVVLFIKGGSSVTPIDEPVSTEYFAMNIASGSGPAVADGRRIGKSWFRRKMVRMGSGIGGGDGRDYSVLSMRCVRENFDTTWGYFAGIITNPSFDSVEYANFRKNVLLGQRSRALNADGYSYAINDSIFFQNHEYGRHITEADIERVTMEGLQKHYRSIMVRSRLLVSVVGNVSRSEVKEKLHEMLAKIPEGSYAEHRVGPPQKAFSPGAVFPQFGRKLPTDYMLAYYLIPSPGDSDYYAYIRLRWIFGGFVFNHIRVQHNLAYAPNVEDHEGGTSFGTITVQTPYVDSAVKIIYRDVDFFQDNLLIERAIREGTSGWATRNYINSETTSSQAVALGESKIRTGDRRNAFVSLDKLASVTPQQLQNAAKRYLRNFNWVIVGDTTNVSRKLLESR